VAYGEPAYDRVNDSLSCPSDTCTEHLLGRLSSGRMTVYILAPDYTDICIICGQKLTVSFQFVM
jgi:hypothetical protein